MPKPNDSRSGGREHAWPTCKKGVREKHMPGERHTIAIPLCSQHGLVSDQNVESKQPGRDHNMTGGGVPNTQGNRNGNGNENGNGNGNGDENGNGNRRALHCTPCFPKSPGGKRQHKKRQETPSINTFVKIRTQYKGARTHDFPGGLC